MLDIATRNGPDALFERLVAGLEIEFGKGAAEGLAQRFVDAEGGDFYWEARTKIRWLSGYESLDEEDGALLDRVAVTGIFGKKAYVAVLVVDGWDRVRALLGVRQFSSRRAAEKAYAAAH